MSAKRLRVLCLHGYRTNSQVMRDQTRALRSALGPQTEFVFLDAPFEARGLADEVVESRYASHRPFYEWGDIERLEREQANGWHHRYTGFDTTVAFMDEQLRAHGAFDVALGFSQGGQMITALTMYYLAHRGEAYWKCCVICCGTRVRDAGLRPLFEDADGTPRRVPLPSVHVLGTRDRFYGTCREHTELYGEPKAVFEHDGGHRFPSADRHGDMYSAMATLIRGHCED